MGSVVQTMKKIIVLLLAVFSTAHAEISSQDVDAVKKEICDRLPTLYGWCSQEKALAMFDLVLETKPEICVEIGVFGGASLFPAAMALKLIGKGTIIGIDPWDRLECIRHFDPIADKEHIKWWSKLNLDYIYSSYLHCLRSCGLDVYVQTIRKTSLDAAAEISSIDILHLDGDFGGDMPMKDVLLYLPKVKSGGYIWLNDAIKRNRDAAIEVLLESCYIEKAVSNQTCILFRKR